MGIKASKFSCSSAVGKKNRSGDPTPIENDDRRSSASSDGTIQSPLTLSYTDLVKKRNQTIEKVYEFQYPSLGKGTLPLYNSKIIRKLRRSFQSQTS